MATIDGEAVSLLLKGKAIVADWPWGGNDERVVDGFFRRLLAEAERAGRAFRDVLSANGMTELTRAEVADPLPADVRVPTILTDPPFRVFDAIFHWED